MNNLVLYLTMLGRALPCVYFSVLSPRLCHSDTLANSANISELRLVTKLVSLSKQKQHLLFLWERRHLVLNSCSLSVSPKLRQEVLSIEPTSPFRAVSASKIILKFL